MGRLQVGALAVVVQQQMARMHAVRPVHALEVLAIQAARLAGANLQPAVDADDVKDLAHHGGDFGIVAGGFGHLTQFFLTIQGKGHGVQLGFDQLHAFFQECAQAHGVAAGGEIAEALIEDGVQEHGRGGRAVAVHFAHAPEQLARHHRTHVNGAVGQLDDAPGDQAAVVQNFGRVMGMHLLADDPACTRSQGGDHRRDNLVDSVL